MILTNKVYNVLKWIVMIFLPAIGTLYFALAETWGFPYVEQVLGTLTAVNAFLGTLIGISTAQFKKPVGKK